MILLPRVFAFASAHQLGHSVDVDLSLLQASAEEHGRRHQQVVGDAVSVNVHRCDLAAKVGANLGGTCRRGETLLIDESQKSEDKLKSFDLQPS